MYGYLAMQLPKVQFNFKIDPDLKGRAYAAAKDAGQEIGVYVSRAIEARLAAEKKGGKR